MDLSRDQILELCRDVCPNCAAGAPLRQRIDTGEFVHDFTRGSGTSHAFCLAHHLRLKYREVLDG